LTTLASFGAGDLFEVTPDNSCLQKFVNLSGPFSALEVLDVVPNVRQVTPQGSARRIPPSTWMPSRSLRTSAPAPPPCTRRSAIPVVARCKLLCGFLWLDGDPEGGGARYRFRPWFLYRSRPGVPVGPLHFLAESHPGHARDFCHGHGRQYCLCLLSWSAFPPLSCRTRCYCLHLREPPPSGILYTVSAMVRDAFRKNGIFRAPGYVQRQQ